MKKVHYLAPFPILFGITGVIIGGFWLVTAGTEDDGPPSSGLIRVFGWWYLGLRVTRVLIRDPMSVLPAFGILAVSAGLIWLGAAMW